VAKELRLPANAVERLLKKAGADRVAGEAAEALRDFVSAEARDLARRAWQLAEHAGRKTVLAEDVKLAKKTMAGAARHRGEA